MLSKRQNEYYSRTSGMLPQEPIKRLQRRGYPTDACCDPNDSHSKEPSIRLDSSYGSYGAPSKTVGRRVSSRDARFQEYDCKYDGDDDDCTSTTWSVGPDESWSDPAIRWSQNRHDGITPAAPPLRKSSVHTTASRRSRGPPPRPLRTPSSHCSLPPRAASAPASYCERSVLSAPALARRDSSSTAPSMPSRMPSTHSTCSSARRPPSRPIRTPTQHSRASVCEEESACPSFYDLSVDRVPEQEPMRPIPYGSQRAEEALLEVAPGVRLPLRRSTETLEAIRNDFYVPTTCFGCGQDLFCIEDAEHCICPGCKTISPLEAAVKDNDHQHHGVGIGFTASTLWQTQTDFMEARRQRAYSIH